MIINRLFLLFTLFTFLVTSAFGSTEDIPTEKVKLRLVWKHQFQFAGYYMAIQKGFYAQRGLDVEIIEYDPTINNLKAVTSGETEFAVGRSSLLINKAEGTDVVALLAAFQRSPFMLMTRAFTGIKKPADLRGQRIMLTPDAANSGELIAMLLKAGLKIEDYINQPHSFNVDDLIDKKTDAMASYVSNEPYKMIQLGLPYNILHPADYGFDMYADILFTSGKNVKEKPDLVENFYEASIEGWKYAFANIEESVNIIHQHYNSQQRSREALLYEAQELKKLAFDGRKNFGSLLPHRFHSMAHIYLLAGIINITPELDGFIYNPPAGKLNLTYEELAYIKHKQNINVCTQIDWLPYEQVQGDKYRGILADFTHLIRDTTGLSISHTPTESSAQALALTRQGICDITPTLSGPTDAGDNLLSSNSYIHIPLVYVSQQAVHDITRLKGKVAVVRNSVCYHLVQNQPKLFNTVEVDSITEALDILIKKQVDGVIGSEAHIRYILANKAIDDLQLTDYIEHMNISYAMNRQQRVLHSILNKTLKLISPQQRDKIMSRWLIPAPRKDISNQTYIIIISIIMLFSLFTLYRYINALMRSKILKELSETDQLTGIANRRKAIEEIQQNIDLSNRYDRSLSLIFFDIDDFKKINDKYGHKTGDQILIQLTRLIEKQIRKTDTFARWGGEEFILSTPEATLADATQMAWQLQTKIHQHDFILDHKVTCSFGISNYQTNESLNHFINRADKAMYQAKQKGKDCIFISEIGKLSSEKL